VKNIIDKLGKKETAGFDRTEAKKPKIKADKLYELVNADSTKPYDMLQVIECLVDDSEFEQYKQDYGKTICAAMPALMAGP
jgi:3-methylcrotonyl-CoA carboxylase beta subunit